jgi:hypothetical protein
MFSISFTFKAKMVKQGIIPDLPYAAIKSEFASANSQEEDDQEGDDDFDDSMDGIYLYLS